MKVLPDFDMAPFFLYVIHLVREGCVGGYGLASNMSEYGCTPMCVFGVFLRTYSLARPPVCGCIHEQGLT
jgi:hypothetical protein